ncbi:MAG TPA: ATP-binding protein [Gracilimonas sp.]|uniref:sensor histidine kinase n=1 Tax=Gracilimonas sp. TaxID=1974203 RepID=UPI002DA77111|nr:ATP-binding protein [Gracilimonas sp.]
MKHILFCVLILFGFSSSVISQGLNGYPIIRNYSPDEYDGHVQNWAFAEDSAGILYISNTQNIIRYDGVNWFDTSIPNSSTYSIHLTEGKKLFAAGSDEFGYLSEPNDDSLSIIQYYSLRQLVSDTLDLGRIFNIESLGESVYFQSGAGLVRYNGVEAKFYKPEDSFTMLFRLEDQIYVREANQGIKRIQGDSLILIPGGDFFSDRSLSTVLELPDKDIFCSYQECFIYEEESFFPFDTEVDDYISSNYLDEAIVLEDGNIAMATRLGGVLFIDEKGNLLQLIDENNGLINNTVYGIYEDRNGSVWVATVNGISRIDFSLPLRVFDERTGVNEAVLDLLISGDELIYGTSQGLYHLNDDLVEKKATGMCGQVDQIFGNIFAVCGSQLLRYDGSIYVVMETPGPVRKFTEFQEPNRLVVVSNDNVYVLEIKPDNSFSLLYTIEESNIEPITVKVDDSKHIWVGRGNSGLLHFELKRNGEEIVDHSAEIYFSDITNQQDDGRIDVTKLGEKPIFLTYGKGLQQFNKEVGKMTQVTRYGSLFSDTTRQFFWAKEDMEGNVWFRSGGEYQGALLQENGTYKTYEGALKLIDHRQNNVIYPDSSGYVWYGTDRGLVRFNKDHSFDHSKLFPTLINEVLVRNDSLINGGDSDPPVLEYQENELRFTYAAASYYAPEETQYRVQLVGFDEDWSIWTTETQKDYTNIPEGEYHFVVEAQNIFGVVSRSESFSFSILPPWYRTWWAFLMYVIAISGILYFLYKIRVNQLLRVERIRNSIASDLHDEVSATLSSISYFAQAIKSDKLKGDKNRFVDLIANSAGDAKEKITDIVWAINPEHDDWQELLSKCRRFASDLLESKGIKYSLKIDEHIPGKLDMRLRQHLWLIFKEMVTNAARHSEAKHVDVILKYKKGHLKLVVQDDGKGMDVDSVKKGNGMVNINKRADLIKGEISLNTSEGFGTRWILKVSV